MRLSAPANYDSAILPELKANSVYEIYGRLNHDVVGGGRPNYMATPIAKRSLAAYISAVHANGLEFNYLLNSACQGNREWTPAYHRQLDRLLAWLDGLRVETITVASPYLLQIIKQRQPRFKVKVGIYAQVDTVKRAEYWDQLGADAINLESFSINRDFPKLQAIRAAVKADLVLISNHICQPNCPYQLQHQNGHAHASGSKTSFLIDYPLLQCQQNRLSNPRLFIASGWIRPEDIASYEAIGYQTFKLLERNIPSADLVKRAQAYHARRFEGNLADLLLSWGFSSRPPRFSWAYLAKTFQPWKMKLGAARTVMDFMKSQGMMFPLEGATDKPIHIDSAAIPANFLDHFRRQSCLDKSCASCGYCQAVADKAVRINPDFLAEVLPKYRQVSESLVDGSIWD